MTMVRMSVCNCKVGIHFDSIQIGPDTAARFMLGATFPADKPGADKMGLRERPGWLEVYT